MTNWTKVADIKVPGGPDCMELTADGKTLYVTSRWIKQVSVVDMGLKAVVASAGVGKSPHGIYFDDHVARQ
jgi:YVTN family beta-propeller protein